MLNFVVVVPPRREEYRIPDTLRTSHVSAPHRDLRKISSFSQGAGFGWRHKTQGSLATGTWQNLLRRSSHVRPTVEVGLGADGRGDDDDEVWVHAMHARSYTRGTVRPAVPRPPDLEEFAPPSVFRRDTQETQTGWRGDSEGGRRRRSSVTCTLGHRRASAHPARQRGDDDDEVWRPHTLAP